MKITIVNSKGGAGKTTLTANAAALLADAGYRVLMVDADIQPTLSSFFEIDSLAQAGLTQVITSGSVADAISTTAIEGLDIIYSNDPRGLLATFIKDTADGRGRLKYALEDVDSYYDIILIDTQGAVGSLQDTGILAADLLVSPLPPDSNSSREFQRGTLDIIDKLRPMARMGLPVAPLLTLLYRMARTTDAQIIAGEAAELDAQGVISLMDTIIPARTVFNESSTLKTPAHRLDKRRRKGSDSPCAREIMETFVAELFTRAAALVPDRLPVTMPKPAPAPSHGEK